MSQYATLNAAIAAAIKQNGNNEITGNLLQQQLLAMVNSLGVGYQYVGIATPATNPGTPDQNVFYVASEPGTYVNFSNLIVAENEVAILKWNGSWMKQTTGAATQNAISRFGYAFTNNLLANKIIGEMNIISLPTGVTQLYLNTFNRGIVVGGTTYWVIGFRDDNAITDSDEYAVLLTSTPENDSLFHFSNNGLIIDIIIDWNAVETNTENKFYGSAKIDIPRALNICFSPYLYSLRFNKKTDGKGFSYDFYGGLIKQGVSIIDTALDGYYYDKSSDSYVLTPNGKNTFLFKPISGKKLVYFGGSGANAVAVCFVMNDDSKQYFVGDSFNSNRYYEILIPSGVKYAFASSYTSTLELYYKDENHYAYTSRQDANAFFKDLYIEGYPSGQNLYLVKVNRSLQIGGNEYWLIIFGATPTSEEYQVVFTTINQDEITDYDIYVSGVRFKMKVDWGVLSPNTENAFRVGVFKDSVTDINYSADFKENKEAGIIIGKFSGFKKGLKISILGDSISCCHRGITPDWDVNGGDSGFPSPQNGVRSYWDMWYGVVAQKINGIIQWVSAYGGSAITRGVREQYDEGGHVIKYMPICDISRWGKLYSDGETGEAPDIIIILGGINDFISNADIGTYDDNSQAAQEQKTFYSAYKYLVNGLIEQYPKAKVVCVSPMKMYGNWFSGGSHTLPIKNAGGKLLEEYANVIKDVASKNCGIFVDAYNNVDFTPYNCDPDTAIELLYTYDGLHPNGDGMKQAGNYIGNAMAISI